jgi:hypothetical protein
MTNAGDAHIIKLRSAVTSPNIVLKTRYNVATEEYIVTGVKSVDWQPVWENMPEYMGTWTLLDAALSEKGINTDDEERLDKIREGFDEFRAKSKDFDPSWNAALDRFADAAKQFGERHAGTEERFLSDYISELDGWYSDTLELLEDALRQAADEFVETLN